MIKRISILIAVTAVAGAFWLIAKPWMMNPVISLKEWHQWIWPTALLILLSSVLALAFMLYDNWPWSLGATFLAGAPFIVIFGFDRLYLLGLAILMIAHVFAFSRIDDELHARVTVKSGHIIRRGLTLVILPILILMSFVYYNTPGVQKLSRTRELPESIMSAIRDTALTIVAPEISQLPLSQRAQAERELTVEISRQLNSFIGPYAKFLPSIFAFGLFLLLQGLSFIFFWLALFVGQSIFLVLRATGFVKLSERDIKAQTLMMGE